MSETSKMARERSGSVAAGIHAMRRGGGGGGVGGWSEIDKEQGGSKYADGQRPEAEAAGRTTRGRGKAKWWWKGLKRRRSGRGDERVEYGW
ncbi:hypothetical protein AB1Y20_020846 [Prymnesium parvum]|uniref:Uncharacterized protein n=1 Tax=Prymnesium parvum TaxID=97485 RepID=A0AB34JWG5_PRYPA